MVPKGSAWDKIIQRMGADWRKATNGEVTLRVYPGGVVGDESEMIRKMRIGQLQAAAISNAGLAEIDPRAYAVMLPMMFESYEEWDYVRQKVNPILEEKLEENGFIVLAWSDAGWVYFFTKERMQRPGELLNMKLAASATEPSTVAIFKWAGFNPVPISMVDLESLPDRTTKLFFCNPFMDRFYFTTLFKGLITALVFLKSENQKYHPNLII